MRCLWGVVSWANEMVPVERIPWEGVAVVGVV